MNIEELKNTVFIGVVEDNKDPNKIGRIKVRVMNVFEQIPTEDIPWAKPFKDLNGNQFITPDVGKVVSVVFDQGNPYTPEYIYAEHYNINLEEKLKELEGDTYVSMRALLFDHKTQIYSNDDEGLKIDYKFNNINILDSSINLNLKDNFSILNIGDEAAAQQAVLGNNWMDWFDEFVDNLLGSNGGPYLGNMGSPVIPNPKMINVLNKYKSLRDTKFLSKHVNIVDNNQVSKKDRVAIGQIGDNWTTTKGTNNTSIQDVNFGSRDGVLGNIDDPSYVAPLTDGTPDNVSGGTGSIPTPLTEAASIPQVDKLIRLMKSKGYIVSTEVYKLNIVGLRYKPNGKITNRFDDKLSVFFKNEKGNWTYVEYSITTVPGYEPGKSELPNNVAILKLGQYIDQYKIGYHQNKPDHKCLKFATSVVHRNNTGNKYNFSAPTERGSFGINIHRSGNPQGNMVSNWSEGCQVFKNHNAFNQFMKICEKQISVGKKSTFTYTLIDGLEYDAFK